MNEVILEPTYGFITDLKSKTGLRDALVASSYGIPVGSKNPVQQEFLNKVLNHAKYTA